MDHQIGSPALIFISEEPKWADFYNSPKKLKKI